MRLRFWGTRGSIPSPGSATVRYGGNTPCVEVRTDTDWLVILDAGTGIRELGRSLVARGERRRHRGRHLPDARPLGPHPGHPLLRADLPAGQPLHDLGPEDARDEHRPRDSRPDVAGRVSRSPFEQLDATIDFCEIAEERRDGNGYEVTAFAVRHPGGALGYRFTGRAKATGRSSTSRTTSSIPTVHVRQPDRLEGAARRVRARRDGAGARRDVHGRRVREASRVGAFDVRGRGRAGAGRRASRQLVLFHHRPERTDDDVDRCVAACRALVAARGGTLTVTAAAEGMTLDI